MERDINIYQIMGSNPIQSDADPSMPFDLKNQIKLGKFILVIKG